MQTASNLVVWPPFLLCLCCAVSQSQESMLASPLMLRRVEHAPDCCGSFVDFHVAPLQTHISPSSYAPRQAAKA